jgi:hypothetical protein
VPAWLLAVLAVLTVARLTRIVTDDDLTAPLRARIAARTGPDSGWTTLVTCPWCSGWWLAWPVAVAVILWPTNRVILVGLLACAASMAVGLLARWSA